ncbi:MAG: hypothetical protein ACRCTQ_02660 [Brevinemataceae bacterium]
MKNLIFILFSAHIILSVFVYKFQKISNVHIIKYSGNFSIVYNNPNKIPEDFRINQPITIKTIVTEFITLIEKKYIFGYKSIILSSVTYLISHPRAPPFVQYIF